MLPNFLHQLVGVCLDRIGGRKLFSWKANFGNQVSVGDAFDVKNQIANVSVAGCHENSGAEVNEEPFILADQSIWREAVEAEWGMRNTSTSPR